MTSNIDTKVSNYSVSELMAIAELQTLEPDDIVNQTNKYIEKFKTSNPVLSVFFMEIQSQLLQYSTELIDPSNPDASFSYQLVCCFCPDGYFASRLSLFIDSNPSENEASGLEGSINSVEYCSN